MQLRDSNHASDYPQLRHNDAKQLSQVFFADFEGHLYFPEPSRNIFETCLSGYWWAVTPPIVFPSESFFLSCPILHPSHPFSHSLLNLAYTFHFLHCHLISVRLRFDHIAIRRAIAIAYEVHITQIVLFNGLAPGLSINASDGLPKV